MPVAIVFPKVSLETDVGTIARWLKDNGAAVAPGEALFEIDNDKAAVEVEATAPGTVVHLRKAGDEVRVGDVVGHILAAGEQPPALTSTTGTEPSAETTGGPQPPTNKQASHGGSRIVATPLARRLAEQSAIDLSAIQGSGPRGRIQKKDLIGLAKASGAAQKAATGARLNAVWLQKEGAGTIVALHGFASDHNAWRTLLAAGRPDARFLAVDLPGHGGSPRTVPADLDLVCDMVEGVLAEQGVDSATVVGHSFGAAVAARLASRGFLSVRSLLMISPAGLGPEIREEFLKGFVAARQASSLLPWLRELVFDPGVLSQAFLRSVEEQRRDEGLSASLRAFAELHFCDGTQTFSIRPDLERLRMPARIIFGIQDRIIPFSHCHALPGRIGLHAFQRCGHLPFLEQPDMTMSILEEMLALANASDTASLGERTRHVA
ncbi:acetoin dehydrogenase dihydrolipoyllysine-residue acetyltransferase subunit [Mesorhizobium sp. ES1-1]|uniref:acetoin dehydrogenase dihydrolipoyllysine-residue acetyltransferase subunit n=1 Tax=Mesorhizobium sp. ES1-1 TaxID=2876629 RepID=UPI001CC9DEB1|nr:acetoin dehydrogenase dihydrolipoyllysine-residue acetyltransferase subunit [Mesorhizobium sp. ES1-1]MBZ9676493.1 acetoin dehydrogenase dihydrolipoyllysine-residue acetyltransferase subunit [Mesorhizobium sp. ES1-1]